MHLNTKTEQVESIAVASLEPAQSPLTREWYDQVFQPPSQFYRRNSVQLGVCPDWFGWYCSKQRSDKIAY